MPTVVQNPKLHAVIRPTLAGSMMESVCHELFHPSGTVPPSDLPHLAGCTADPPWKGCCCACCARPHSSCYRGANRQSDTLFRRIY
jgi:hypothetical protein